MPPARPQVDAARQELLQKLCGEVREEMNAQLADLLEMLMETVGTRCADPRTLLVASYDSR